jgi:hypothetical protein
VVHQARHDVSAQRQTRGPIAIAVALASGMLQKGRVREDIRRRPELAEELLGRKQRGVLWDEA